MRRTSSELVDDEEGEVLSPADRRRHGQAGTGVWRGMHTVIPYDSAGHSRDPDAGSNNLEDTAFFRRTAKSIGKERACPFAATVAQLLRSPKSSLSMRREGGSSGRRRVDDVEERLDLQDPEVIGVAHEMWDGDPATLVELLDGRTVQSMV